MKLSGVKVAGGVKVVGHIGQSDNPAPEVVSKFATGGHGPNSGYGRGFVFNSDGTNQVTIFPSQPIAYSDQFGSAGAAIANDKVAIAARYADSQQGAMYVYNTDGTGELRIVASDRATAGPQQFGESFAINSTKIAVGAKAFDGYRGHVYLYNIDGTNEIILVGHDSGDVFGESVDLSETKLVVGARGDDDVFSGSGSAYVYNLDGTGEVKITASDPTANAKFGEVVNISDTKVAVASIEQNSFTGAVYVYNLDGTGEVKVTASDASAGHSFGTSVAIGSKLVVGSPGSNNGNGTAYVYNTDGTGELKITASDGAGGDQFGSAVAITDTKIFVGARNENGSRGAVYVYNLDGTGEVKVTASNGVPSDTIGAGVLGAQ